MKRTVNEISFLPEDYVERRKEQRTNVICLGLFAIMLVAVIGAWAVTDRHRSDVKAQREQVNGAYAEAARRIEQLEKLQQQKNQMLRKAQVTATLVEPVPRTFVLADLINRMPTALSLLELKLSTRVIRPAVTADAKRSALANKGGAAKGPAVEAPPAREIVSLGLVGVAPTDVQVAQYMATLSRSPLVSEVNLVFSEEARIAETPMRRFRIEMTLDEKANVRHVEPLLVERRIKGDPMRLPTAVVPPPPDDDAIPSLGNVLQRGSETNTRN